MSPDRRLSVTMPMRQVLPCTQDADWVCCLHCAEPLQLHQPRSGEPERLVGTCNTCGRWYLLDWHPGANQGLMLLLPDHDEFLAAATTPG